MKLYPCIAIRHGRAVQTVDGGLVPVDEARQDPLAQAQALVEAGARRLHVVDLDAAFGEPNQWRHVSRVLAAGVPVQVAGGVRHMTQIQQLLDLGAERVTVGTQAVRHPRWAQELGVIFPGRVVLSLDARGRDLTVDAWTQDTGLDLVATARGLDGARFSAFLYTDVQRTGRLDGVDLDVVAELRAAAPATPLLVRAGVRGADDLDRLAAAGADGVVLERSLDAGGLDLAAAVARHDPLPAPAARPVRRRPAGPAGSASS